MNEKKMIPFEKPTFNAFLLGFAFVLLVLGAALSFINHDFFVAHFVVEDGPTEWMTFFILLASAVLCFSRWWHAPAEQPSSYRAVLLLLTLLFVFGAGEEISWGQRIFDIQSNEFFLEHNAQNETNLHNLMIGDIKLNKLIFGTGFALILLIYLAVFTPLYHKNPKAKSLLNQCAVPIARIQHVIAFIVLLVVVEVIMTSSKRGEMTECVGALIVLATLLYPYNRCNFKTCN